jgi:acyl carrier protein
VASSPGHILEYDATQARKVRLRKAAENRRESEPAKTPVARSATPPAPREKTPPAPPVVVSKPPSASRTAPEPAHSGIRAQAPKQPVPVPATTSTKTSADLRRLVIDFVIEQTGFPASTIDAETKLHSDLGMDDSDRSMFIAELCARLDVAQTSELSGHALDHIDTVGDIITALARHVGGNGAGTTTEKKLAQTRPPAAKPATTSPPTVKAAPTDLPTDRLMTRFVLTSAESPLPKNSPELPTLKGSDGAANPRPRGIVERRTAADGDRSHLAKRARAAFVHRHAARRRGCD